MRTVKVNLKNGRYFTFTKTHFDLDANIRHLNDGNCLLFSGHNDGKQDTIIPADAIESIESTREEQ